MMLGSVRRGGVVVVVRFKSGGTKVETKTYLKPLFRKLLGLEVSNDFFFFSFVLFIFCLCAEQEECDFRLHVGNAWEVL